MRVCVCQEIGAYIPIANPQLKDYVYEMVLNHYLRHDHKGFYNLITEWPHTIYNIQNLITTVQERVKETTDIQLMDALATLYAPTLHFFFLFFSFLFVISVSVSFLCLFFDY